ncbi:MAG: N-acetylmuramoyl-L-alanine amidase [Planctomycetota bacterium]|nr:MAG: N-acetylmuramoyl-L-alanine amidase [Planctomycetota bacterium]
MPRFAIALVLLLCACAAPPLRPAPAGSSREATATPRRGTEISICGELFDIGTPVVLWYDEGGYSAYHAAPFFGASGKSGLRYKPGRADPNPAPFGRAEPAALTLEHVRARVDQFVLHFDVCGTSRECFRVLQDARVLSVHFLLDADGAIYQTLDLADTAWHARQANPRSVGVEIAQIGCYRVGKAAILDQWYPRDEQGPYLKLPERLAKFPFRDAAYTARPERPERIRGAIHGAEYEQHDYTARQNEALAKLVGGVARALPRIRLDYPRGADGAVLDRALDDAEFRAFSGVLGHWHVTEDKVDPGPALDFERLIERARTPTN